MDARLVPDTTSRVLISTTLPQGGGVPQMTRFVADCLQERGFDPVLAYYQPYSLSPELSVPSFRLFQRTIGSRPETALNQLEGHAMGAWFPELEFTHYWPTRLWGKLIDSCSYHLAVSGSCLAGLPYALSHRPFLAWVASSWHGDRKDRVAGFPWYRRWLDSGLNARVTRRLEKRILHSGTVLALSAYTRAELESFLDNGTLHGMLPMPVDAGRFRPDPAAVVPGKLGFVGRIDDPRKNIPLLVQAIALIRQQHPRVSAELIGGDPGPVVQNLIEALELRDTVAAMAYMPREQLPERLRTMDVFVLPSHQEGLCIAALEAMACGCPVVSTRCGGPEEFVIDGETGFLVDNDPAALAAAIGRIVGDRSLRQRLSLGARQLVENRYDLASARRTFWQAFEHAFPWQKEGVRH